MLEATFVHAQGVGFATERGLWDKGVRSWGDALSLGEALPTTKRTRSLLLPVIEESVAALARRDVAHFARTLPGREHWRTTRLFPRLGYLDIETDGDISPDSVTVIGLSDGFDCRIFVKGKDLPEFVDAAMDFDGYVTFFGAGFDLPMLKKRFPVMESAFRDRFHIDLCPALRRLGYSGGLKSIEHQVGINRVPEAEGLDGMDAVRLWSIYRSRRQGAEEALRLLLAYNREDVMNMKLLLDFALPRLRALSGFDAPLG